MDASAVVMMIIGMVIIWGGLGASILHAVRKAKASKSSL
ncbi:methionine/alanine import family NSS transporter small subunit [Falsibacillus pallidus]|uniref:Putative methionine/alanine importer small subunit n=1 Tax=Falsibacillus pallidus TaxID=493781 RepID=A0A370GCA7_9BACI|nr:methionine/alanine import family NSS transporter small subunit [Falsibacillus pallidus]RDI41452.1 putative methionine/alanine importer small subunit [Falsibacillus pallidus]